MLNGAFFTRLCCIYVKQFK